MLREALSSLSIVDREFSEQRLNQNEFALVYKMGLKIWGGVLYNTFMQHLSGIIKNKRRQWMELLRFRLARPDALLQLALLGLITGVISGGVIVLFRFLVEGSQDYLLPGESSENYEGLATNLRFLFPLIASVLLALMFYKTAKGIRVLGIARVMERMAYHQGYLNVREFFLQFFGSAIAIIGGHSVGREGPHVHLGATSGSLFGQLLKLPNNSIRVLVASGAAAGIAASFNTPLAGVIFALEVIMMEYTLGSFVPVMLASVAATAVSNMVFGSEPAFILPDFEFSSYAQLPLLLFLGVAVGATAAAFNHLLGLISTSTQKIEIWWRVLIAGLLIAMISFFVPEVMGIGYDSVNEILWGGVSLSILLTLCVAKLIASSISIGLGIPGGMIGPAFFIGASLGGVIGYLSSQYFGFDSTNIGFYALLGMGAMMGASLQAPLAALVAIMELTYNPNIILPGMLTIVVAQLTVSEVFNKPSLFISMLRSNGLDYDTNPVTQVLRGIGVASLFNKKTKRLGREITVNKANTLIAEGESIDWIILQDKEGIPSALMPISELAKFIKTNETNEEADLDHDGIIDDTVDLYEIPANRLQLSPLSLQANLQQAHDKFEQGAEALFIIFDEKYISAKTRVYGIITPAMVEAAYKPQSKI